MIARIHQACRFSGFALSLVFVANLLAPYALAQPGALDPSFGDGGVVLVDDASVCGMAMQTDGRIVALGGREAAGYCWGFPTLWRFHPDGAPDGTFGEDGAAALEPFIAGAYTYGSTALAVVPSGAVVAVGHTYVIEPPALGGGWRVHPDGTPDATFRTFEVPAAVAARPDGRYVIVGGDDAWGSATCGVLQFLPDGTLDPTFSDGFVDLTLDEHAYDNTWCTGAALLGDGRLVVFLAFYDYDEAEYWGAARLLEDGSLDPTFGDGGIALVPLDGYLAAGAVAADGSVLLAGSGPGYPDPDYPMLVQLTAEGALDPAFGEAGIATLEVLGEGNVRGVVSLPGGGAAFTGSFNYNRPRALAVRVLPDGTLDPAFGEGGVVTFDYSVGHAVMLDADGRIVVGGETVSGDGFIARLLNDGAVAAEPPVQPGRVALDPAAPNPTSGRTVLTYTLSEAEHVRFAVYDVLGREVAVLVEGARPAGAYEVTLDASRLSPGLYILRLTAGYETATCRLTVVQ